MTEARPFDPDQVKRGLALDATALGFAAIGVASIEIPEDERHLLRWLNEGFHGEMDYMERHGVMRSRPQQLAPGTVRVVSARMDYWPAGAREFRAVVDDYAAFHWAHMRKEEEQLFPLARRYLMAEDWKLIDAAFAANPDPVAGVTERDFRELFSRIANLAPAPVGLGEPWKSVRA